MATVALSDSAEEALSGLVRDLQAARRVIDGYLARIATEADRRQRGGSGPEPGDLFRGSGEVSRGEADRQAERGRLGNQFPATADRMHSGGALTENLDTMARLIRHLGDAARARLTVFDTEIADRAVALPPETFVRRLRKLIRSIVDDDQPSTAERQRAASKVNLGRKRNGMWWISGTFDPERGAELDRMIRTMARKLADTTTPPANTRADALHRLATGLFSKPFSLRPADSWSDANPERSPDTGSPIRLGIGYLIDARTLLDGEHSGPVAQT